MACEFAVEWHHDHILARLPPEMSLLLLWLAIPLVLIPWCVDSRVLTRAVSGLLVVGFALGALNQGAATLDPR